MSRFRNARTGSLGSLLVVVLVIGAVHSALAMGKSDLWPRWATHNPNSSAVIDHERWQHFLAAYLVAGQNGVNQLRYGQVNVTDRRALDAYLKTVAAIQISDFHRDEQLAYWVNIYNALTVRIVLDHFPVASILEIDISPGWFSIGPWKKKLIRIEGWELSLDDIEHRILRPIWRDPRIHYAISCGSTGCPNLGPNAYTGATIEQRLAWASRAYVNNWRGAMFDDGALYVSSIYKWFREDFGGTDASVIAHLRAYAEPDLRDRLSSVRDISGYYYDWALNDAQRPF